MEYEKEDQMGPEVIRHLKHELRTPINHLVGYTSLLLEIAQDDGDLELSKTSSEINQIANELARAIGKALTDPSGSVTREDLGSLQKTVVPLIEKITRVIQPDPYPIGFASHLEDLSRIRSAVNRLQNLVESMHDLTSKAP
jgi:signal transduction histidine kinase